jgi:hypothetical protein
VNVTNTVNVTTAATFAPFSNTSETSLNTPDHGLNTLVPGSNKTINATANIISELNGSLKVSISGIKYPVTLLVVLDNETVGTVEPTTPLYLVISEGNHTVMVCTGSMCKQENVTTRFGKYVTVDFSEQIENDMEIHNPTAQPTARILDYNRNGNTISIDVEFFNPSTNDHLMSAEISCGYTYIDDRTSIKMGDSVKGNLVQNVKAGERITERLDLYFTNGKSLSYSGPVIEELQIK